MSTRWRVTAVLGALSFVIASAVVASPERAGHGPIPWITSMAEGKTKAYKEKKPLLVDFYAEWCGPCKAMAATTWKDKRVVAKARKFVPVLIDIDKNERVSLQYSVEGVPTIVFLSSKGKLVKRHVGGLGPDDMLRLMDEALKAKG